MLHVPVTLSRSAGKVTKQRMTEPGGSLTTVGVGASAGGLEAFTDLLRKLPDDTGFAFVLVQHLNSNSESHLVELLSKATAMPVSQIDSDTRAQANHVYVNSPGLNPEVSDGILSAKPRIAGSSNMAIDEFFKSLAEDLGTNAIGVVLSGSATDGTLGLGAIRAAGGVTFAQETSTAKCDGMPGSAIAAGVVDHVLSPTEIAAKLTKLSRSHRFSSASHIKTQQPDEAALKKIFRLLYSATGVDFSLYKPSTLTRRIKRRMELRGFTNLDHYRRELETNDEEVVELFENCLIVVTAFFRQPEVFEALKKFVFPALVENRRPDDPIRIWVPGCATGEEAYSIAMCLAEFLDAAALTLRFEIFATDISGVGIEKARTGIYAEAARAPVSDDRMAHFFTKVDSGYQITKALRDVCVFARHNLAQDPPFSKLDLVSCNNVLIYLGVPLQRQVLSLIHYALKPAGFLVLGASEGIGTLSDSFHQLETTQKIFGTRPAGGLPEPHLSDRRRSDGRLDLRKRTAGNHTELDLQQEADRLVLAEHGPPGAVFDENMSIVQVRGHTAPYLELSPGEPSHSLLKLAREGLMVGLGKAARTAIKTNAIAVEEGFRIESDGQLKDVSIKVIPLVAATPAKGRYFLVLFQDQDPKPAKKIKGKPGNLENARLQRELAATREYLQTILDDKVSTLGELRVANEEAQAANEELVTAQEELESANEELNTLNENLKARNVELSFVNRDLANLLESISIPLVIVGCDLRIRRFTRAMEPMLNLIPSDVGRSITDLKPQIDLPDLEHVLLDAMNGGREQPRDLRDSHGRWYSLRILPSLGPDGKSDGAVLMLIDIDASKRGLDFAEAIVETVREPLVILNQKLKVVKANRSFYETFKAVKEDTENQLIYDLGNGQWNIPKLRELLEDVLPARSTFRDFEVTHLFEHVGRKVMLLNASEIFNPSAQSRTILLAIEDATDRKSAEEALLSTNAELQHFAYALTHDLQEPLRMVVNFTGLLAEEYAGKMGEEADTFISYSVEGALRIDALSKALLAYWEVTARKHESVAPIDCSAVMSNVRMNLQTAIEQSGAVITCGPLPTLTVDEIVLIQIFQNLISNSIKYRSEEAPVVHVSAQKGAGEWIFSVRDNGIGIDPLYADRVFGMFKRLHGNEIPGTGIGLALCRKIVDRLGGRIWLESEIGKGTTFKFTIPSGLIERGSTQGD